MQKQKIEDLLAQLDGSGSDAEFSAVRALQAVENLPALLLQKYRNSKLWSQRASCVYHAVKYSSQSPDAYELGVVALKDKSKVVRYRAAMLLAVSQNPEAVAPL